MRFRSCHFPIVVVGVVMTFLLIGCNGRQHQLVAATVNIANCVPSLDPAPISMDGEVNWTGDGVQTYTVKFTALIPPFDQRSYSVPSPAAVPSGVPGGVAKACATIGGSCSYKYVITGSKGCNGPDPHVIISR
jgi:hypothetical protein